MLRSNAYNEGQFYNLIPIHRQAVVPGQSVEMTLKTVFETPPFLGNLMAGGIASIYAYYVPNRLVWDQWVDFISDPQSGLSVPTTTTPWDYMFERASVALPVSVLPRRGYKLIYNEFFGSSDFGFRYGDITFDSDVSIRALKTNDQWLGKLFPKGETADPRYLAPVTGTAPDMVATITLNDLRKDLQLGKQIRRADMTGNKYVDAMLRLGVKLDWRVQVAPEFIGACHKEFEPKDTRATYSGTIPAQAAANTGQSFSRYQETLECHVPRKFFAEHGYVHALLAVRPFAFNAGFLAPADAVNVAYEEFFLGENQAGVDGYDSGQFAGGADEAYTMRFEYLRSGHNMIGLRSTAPWVPTDVSSDLSNAVYISAFDIAGTDQLQNQLATFTRVRSGGPTPVRKGVI